ncbi:TetR/AcrR family transcriptional regulator [Tsukamurella tyrosinosolvens]|uniref:TetR/AcrR family transcriptional regulator n=1 Tax=Tsukamurella tyrosinosolvens TaxID=57704 RepID=UPI000C7F3B09|nr:TetR/AcrR family transcriptional regulator [Tsukamurella tyrosinosolvens]AUN40835.1 TetR family transcriptional regulator [Tsukamurella tyrosinosolvens]
MTEPETLSRAERRKLRTRRSLLRAAQQLLAEERTAVSVLEITALADVGNGSFYNHFATKDELFDAAVMAVIDDHGAAMDRLTEGIADPAEAFTQSFRMTGRLHRLFPQMSRIVVNSGSRLLASETGLLPRARRDITAAALAGRFPVDDPELALTVASGAALSLAVLLLEHPERDDAEATDAVTAHVLRSFGVTESDITTLVDLPLPASSLQSESPREL